MYTVQERITCWINLLCEKVIFFMPNGRCFGQFLFMSWRK